MKERWRWALGGAAAAALALAAGELVAGVLGGPSLIAAMATIVIDLQPPGAKDFMVSIFGTNDKLALEIATATVAILIGAAAGAAGQTRHPHRLRRLRHLRGRRLLRGHPGSVGRPADRRPIGDRPPSALVSAALMFLLPVPKEDGTVAGRRSALLLGGLLVVGGVGAVVGRYLSIKAPTVTAPAVIPQPTSTLAPLAAGTSFDDIDGLSPLIVPADEFYKIDTRLSDPAPGCRGTGR